MTDSFWIQRRGKFQGSRLNTEERRQILERSGAKHTAHRQGARAGAWVPNLLVVESAAARLQARSEGVNLPDSAGQDSEPCARRGGGGGFLN